MISIIKIILFKWYFASQNSISPLFYVKQDTFMTLVYDGSQWQSPLNNDLSETNMFLNDIKLKVESKFKDDTFVMEALNELLMRMKLTMDSTPD